MIEGRVGRLLGASLHAAIAETLPDRLEFYEYWLHDHGLHDRSTGLAPITAVFAFLRGEGEAYDRVVDRAGRLAAEWTLDGQSRFRRRVAASLPRPLRVRWAIRIAAAVVREIYSESRAVGGVRKARVRFDVKASLMCRVREPQKQPLCGFYAALVAEMLTRLNVPAHGRVEQCRAVSGPTCRMEIDLEAAA